MIEVIKQGNKNQIECDYCGALLRYGVDDIKRKERICGQLGETLEEQTITCPCCNYNIYLTK